MPAASHSITGSNNKPAPVKGLSAPNVSLQNVSFAYSNEVIFDALNFEVKSGQWTCLIGPSGCGKSTLLKLITGSLREGFTGEIHFSDGERFTGRPAWMAQKDLLLPWLPVIDNVCLGARLRDELSVATREKATSLLQDAGLGGYSNSLPAELSGGMRQRVALLRTLMEERSVILMDEPFSALDALTRLKLQDLAAKMVKGATVLMVTHDPLEALRLGHRIYVMSGRPAQLSQPLTPSGSPPRNPGDPAIIALQGELLDRLAQTSHEDFSGRIQT
jgi:putative hydroxymethylpyrimidine transport system ATP-binding protein